MNIFVDEAWAQASGAPEPGFLSFLPLIVLFVVFYLLLIRPQMKRQKEHQKMVQALAKGDEVVTTGGVLGRLTDVGDDNFVKLQVANNVELKVQRHAISAVMPKGTVKDK